MLKSITVQNFKAFGEEQTLPLNGPITVLVGPNNSGKSAVMSVGAFVRSVGEAGGKRAVEFEEGAEFLFHRPPVADGQLRLKWETTEGSYAARLSRSSDGSLQSEETLVFGKKRGFVTSEDRAARSNDQEKASDLSSFAASDLLGGLHAVGQGRPELAHFRAVCQPLLGSRYVKLSLSTLRRDSQFVAEPVLSPDGLGLAAVLALWRSSLPERATELDEFLQKCMPEIQHALVKPTQQQMQRLWIQQTDKEMFDAAHISDGLLSFVALAMHALDAPDDSVIFVEEPEQSIHPRRLTQLVDLFRVITERRRAQFVVATHSPILLNEFRDQPESIVLLSRNANGTRMKPLSEVPDLVQSLSDNQPGDLLADGFFNEGI